MISQIRHRLGKRRIVYDIANQVSLVKAKNRLWKAVVGKNTSKKKWYGFRFNLLIRRIFREILYGYIRTCCFIYVHVDLYAPVFTNKKMSLGEWGVHTKKHATYSSRLPPTSSRRDVWFDAVAGTVGIFINYIVFIFGSGYCNQPPATPRCISSSGSPVREQGSSRGVVRNVPGWYVPERHALGYVWGIPRRGWLFEVWWDCTDLCVMSSVTCGVSRAWSLDAWWHYTALYRIIVLASFSRNSFSLM